MIQINYMSSDRYPPSSVSKKPLKTDSGVASSLKLSKNEVFEGKVLKLLGSNEALLLVKGEKVTARTDVRMSEGDILSLRVEESLPTPTLKLLGIRFAGRSTINVSMILSAMKENLWESISENMDRLGLPQAESARFRELLDELAHRIFLKPGPDMLKILIDKSGLGWEAKLLKALMNKKITGVNLSRLAGGDLKGLVSRFLELNQAGGALLRRFISTIENIQVLNLLGLEEEGKIFLPVPIQFPDGFFTVGQLLIHMPRKAKGKRDKQDSGKNIFNITLLLELSDLGPVRADLAIKEQEIKGRFLITKEETKVLIENNMISFIRNLKDRGFKIHHMECRLKEPGIVRQSLLKEIVKEEGSSICLVA